MSQLGNAVTYQQYEQSVPITEVAKNTRLSLSSLQSSQCHLQNAVLELKEVVSNLETLVVAHQLYNINEQFVVSDTGTLTLPANTYHSISYVVLSGTASINIGGTILSPAPQGYSGEDEATTLLANSTIITGLSVGTLISVKTIR